MKMVRKVSDEKFEALIAENRFVTDVQLAIERAMDEHGVSQADLARALNVSEARVSQMLADTGKNFQARTIAKIAHALGLHVTLKLVDKVAYTDQRRGQKKLAKSGPFSEWLKSLEQSPAVTWHLVCNDNDEIGLEAA